MASQDFFIHPLSNGLAQICMQTIDPSNRNIIGMFNGTNIHFIDHRSTFAIFMNSNLRFLPNSLAYFLNYDENA